MEIPFSLLTPEIRHSLNTRVATTLLGSSTWLLGLYQRSPVLMELANKNRLEAGIVLLLLTILTSPLFEGIGLVIEHCMDTLRGEKHNRNLDQYRRTISTADAIGFKELRVLEARLKSLLNISGAFVVALIGTTITEVPFTIVLSLLWLTNLCFLLAWVIHGRKSMIMGKMIKQTNPSIKKSPRQQ